MRRFQFVDKLFQQIKDSGRQTVQYVASKEGQSELVETATEVTVVFIGVTLFFENVGTVTYCMGPSMLPTIPSTGSLVLVDVASQKFLGRRIQNGDVVIVQHPFEENKKLCKRIRACGGDVVFRRPPGYLQAQPVEIPKGMVWIAGDNPRNSTDSRMYGPVSAINLKGRVLCRLSFRYPFVIPVTNEIPGLEEEIENFLTITPQDKAIREDVLKHIEGGLDRIKSLKKEQKVDLQAIEEEEDFWEEGYYNNEDGEDGDDFLERPEKADLSKSKKREADVKEEEKEGNS